MENIAGLMTAQLTPSRVELARRLGSAAEHAGLQPYLVGGAVRDLLLGRREGLDFDIVIVGSNDGAFDRIASLTGGLVSGRSQFGTAKLQVDDLRVDLAMARWERYPTAGSLPVVGPGTLAEDLARRDFSVNALAVGLGSRNWGELIDPQTGLADLKRGQLRVLHANSFRDDPTRIIRAARYLARLGFTLETTTRDALLDSVGLLDLVSAARVRNELERVFTEPNVLAALRSLGQWGMLRAIHPALRFEARAWRRWIAQVTGSSLGTTISAAYAVLSFGVTGADVDGLLARLRLGAGPRRCIVESARLGGLPSSELLECRNSQLAELLDPLSEATLIGASSAASDSVGARIREYLNSHRGLGSHTTGDDLIAMGISQGPELGRILKLLRGARLDGEVTTPAEETALVQRLRVDASPE